jgi:23S rRNA pseudouridine2605 synthase
MRINKFVAQASGLSRRSADEAINNGRVLINKEPAVLGDQVQENDKVFLDSKLLSLGKNHTTIILNKPRGYVCSRNGQGSRTIYDLLPKRYDKLKPIGRLDKDSTGLLLLTDDGELANCLTHPKFKKTKVYLLKLNKALSADDATNINEKGVVLEDGISKLGLRSLSDKKDLWEVKMHEGRNRQIRRTFKALNYDVIELTRTGFGEYDLSDLKPAQFSEVY